jgi:hypothetical protein
MRLSLCVICGNESEHILQMLNSFEPIFDELSLVRAIGGQEPDDTVDKAYRWCAENGKEIIFSEYRNTITAQKWLHVDSFADARNAAFAQGTGEWLLWADCDDLIEGTSMFRESLKSVKDDVLMARCPYDVRGSNKKLLRERVIRRETFKNGRRWHHDVHENLLLLVDDKHEDWQQPVWVHSPNVIKRANRKRNLKILGKSVAESATQYFYIHQEHYCDGNRPAAEQFGKIAISFPNLESSFRYEVLLNLARICGINREAMQYALQAHGVFPWCREAIATMILLHFEKQDAKRASYWAETMLKLDVPSIADRPWTHERKWYDWAGWDLAARAARLSGFTTLAEIRQMHCHKTEEPRITLLHATKDNTSNAVACRDAWLNAASNPAHVEHIFAINSDDASSAVMVKQFQHVNVKGTLDDALNTASKKARGNLLIEVRDNFAPALQWDSKLHDLISGRDLNSAPFRIKIKEVDQRIISRAQYRAQAEVFTALEPDCEVLEAVERITLIR